ncbi:hypothetical protein SY2F82_14530 [Streptomyces sp. Y2F8-2]|nr:hypothetical protein SY2F82_14530 [Streptomyces sp. Y2F8-2]
MSETPSNTLQYRFDGPEEAPVLMLGPSLRTTPFSGSSAAVRASQSLSVGGRPIRLQ